MDGAIEELLSSIREGLQLIENEATIGFGPDETGDVAKSLKEIDHAVYDLQDFIEEDVR